jgi:pimeloyl-ACP methyl ester carboxylesterase
MTADSVITATRDDIAFWPLGGSGPPALLLHGFGADHLSWLANQQAVGTVATVSALDLPGHGESSMDVGDGAVATLAERVAALLDQKNLSKVHLVGHSLGGVTALFLAEMRPDLVASLVLIAPAGLGGSIDQQFLADFPRLITPEQALELLQRLVVRPRLINRHLVARVLEQLEGPGARRALTLIAEKLIASEAAIARAAASDAVRALPRLTIWGRQDSINPLSEDRLAAFGGDTLIVPETGHMPHVEAPRLVNEKIGAFLARQNTR